MQRWLIDPLDRLRECASARSGHLTAEQRRLLDRALSSVCGARRATLADGADEGPPLPSDRFDCQPAACLP